MKLKFWSLVIIWSLVLGYWSLAYALRPLFTETSAIVPIGNVVIESGVLLLSGRDNTGISEVVTTLKYGFLNNVDLRVDLPFMTRYSNTGNYDGMSYGSFKVKYNFYNNIDADSASFLVGYQLDNADPNSNNDPNAHNITTMLTYSRNLGYLTYHLNCGYTFDDEPSSVPKQDFNLYNASIIKPINDAVNIMGEIQYSRNTYTYDIFSEAAVGFNFKYNKNLIFDMALGCGLNENSSSNNLTFGVTMPLNYMEIQ